MRNNTSLPKSWVNSALTRALAEKGLTSSHMVAKATGVKPHGWLMRNLSKLVWAFWDRRAKQLARVAI